ncbi:hypothetical protein RhiirA1_443373 [Rhizophagus irregularis]|uniref:Uncharacterized protein n=1 Tax=Rhizophagus irregularis TaxID=588596 RepID=A0A2N0RJA5_9GLOM|nr:hypothetical protein RhiirA1_443373 [Rhizophagus irregularis]
MGQTHPKPETHSKPNSDKSKNYLFTDLPPVPRTYTDDFWRKGNDAFRFSERDIEALNQFRQLDLESLESDDEKESRIEKLCAKYPYAYIPLDVDKDGYARGFNLFESITTGNYGEVFKEYGETLILCIGIEDFNAMIYLGGSGKLYMSYRYEPLKFLYNYKDTGAISSDVLQNY